MRSRLATVGTDNTIWSFVCVLDYAGTPIIKAYQTKARFVSRDKQYLTREEAQAAGLAAYEAARKKFNAYKQELDELNQRYCIDIEADAESDDSIHYLGLYATLEKQFIFNVNE